MASAARDLRYRQSVDGSLARELDWAVRERELRHAGEAPRRRERETERIRAIPRVELRPVSYTHLDVYKRQLHCCLPCSTVMR